MYTVELYPIWKFIRRIIGPWKSRETYFISCAREKDFICIATESGVIYVLSSDGRKKWERGLEGKCFSYPVIDSQDNIYIGTNEGILYAFSWDGKLKWAFKTNGRILSSAAVDADDNIYIPSTDRNLYVIDKEGNLKRKIRIGEAALSSPIISENGVIYIGSVQLDCFFKEELDSYNRIFFIKEKELKGNLYAIKNEKIIWKITDILPIDSHPAIGMDGSIYLYTLNGKLYAISSEGKIKWEFKVSENPLFAPTPVIGENDIIYVCSEDGFIYALNSKGTILWENKIDARLYTTPVIDAEGQIYVVDSKGNLFCINSDGKNIKKIKYGGEMESIIEEGLKKEKEESKKDLKFYKDMPWMTPWAIKLKESYRIEDRYGEVISSPMLDKKGYLYVISPDGLHVLEIKNSYALTSWPMHRSNPQNTGRQSIDYLTAAKIALKWGDKSKAAECFEKAKNFSQAARLYEELNKYEKAGENYEKAGKFEYAIKVYTKVPNYRKIAEIYEKFGNLKKAAENYKKAQEYLKSARIYLKIKNYDEVIKLSQWIIDAEPEILAEAYYMRGHIEDAFFLYLQAENYEKINKIFNEILSSKNEQEIQKIINMLNKAGKDVTIEIPLILSINVEFYEKNDYFNMELFEDKINRFIKNKKLFKDNILIYKKEIIKERKLKINIYNFVEEFKKVLQEEGLSESFTLKVLYVDFKFGIVHDLRPCCVIFTKDVNFYPEVNFIVEIIQFGNRVIFILDVFYKPKEPLQKENYVKFNTEILDKVKLIINKKDDKLNFKIDTIYEYTIDTINRIKKF